MLKHVVRRNIGNSYTIYDLKLDLLSSISWTSYNYLRKFRFHDEFGGDVTVPYYSEYPICRFRKNNPYGYWILSFNCVVVGQTI
jgi:hypothetical protein